MDLPKSRDAKNRTSTACRRKLAFRSTLDKERQSQYSARPKFFRELENLWRQRPSLFSGTHWFVLFMRRQPTRSLPKKAASYLRQREINSVFPSDLLLSDDVASSTAEETCVCSGTWLSWKLLVAWKASCLRKSLHRSFSPVESDGTSWQRR